MVVGGTRGRSTACCWEGCALVETCVAVDGAGNIGSGVSKSSHASFSSCAVVVVMRFEGRESFGKPRTEAARLCRGLVRPSRPASFEKGSLSPRRSIRGMTGLTGACFVERGWTTAAVKSPNSSSSSLSSSFSLFFSSSDMLSTSKRMFGSLAGACPDFFCSLFGDRVEAAWFGGGGGFDTTGRVLGEKGNLVAEVEPLDSRSICSAMIRFE